MSGPTKTMLPSCGLYRTTKALAGHEPQFPAGLLVYFHNHSDSGLPQVLAPDHNVHNRWHFHGPGVEFRGLSWADSLVKVPLEGFYVLKRELAFEGGTWPKGALVQLGYTRNAEPILFIAQVRTKLDENDLWFSDKGVGLSSEQMSILDAIVVFQESTGEGVTDHGPANIH